MTCINGGTSQSRIRIPLLMKSIFDDLELSLNTPGDISFFVCTYNDGYDIYFVISMEIILECFVFKKLS